MKQPALLTDLYITTETFDAGHTSIGLHIHSIEIHRSKVALLIATQCQGVQLSLWTHLVDNTENLLRGNA